MTTECKVRAVAESIHRRAVPAAQIQVYSVFAPGPLN